MQQITRFLRNSLDIRSSKSSADVFTTCWSVDWMSTELTVPDSIVFLASWPAYGYGKKLNDSSKHSKAWTIGKIRDSLVGSTHSHSSVLRAACFKASAETKLRQGRANVKYKPKAL